MSENVTGTARVKRGMAEMLKGGVIMDVVTAEQAKIAEDAGAVAVMALERVPADIRAQGVTRIEDMINTLPQAFASQGAFISNGASGTATVIDND
jgi:pyridoxal biosynthesis lyase PdxS